MRKLFAVMLGLLMAQALHAATLVETVAQMKQSVVGISILYPTKYQQAQLIGSGFAVADGHYVVTNYHVVREHDVAAKQMLYANVWNGPVYDRRAVKVIAVAPAYDLALLKIDGPALPAVKFYTKTDMAPEGSDVAITGFPIGAALGLTPATARGIVSALTPNRGAEPNSFTLGANDIRAPRYLTYQLDIIAYPGNSGGPVYMVDSGEVLAIVSASFIRSTKEKVLSDPSAITYAIPSTFIRQMLIENKLAP